MQILEFSGLGLRSARHIFTNSSSSISVTIFPMVHIGEQSFYDRVYSDAFSHDVVLVEGVRSSVVRQLTTSYRWISYSKLGLVEQPSYPSSESVSALIVNADLSTKEFNDEWKNVPNWLKMTVHVMAPIVGLQRRLFASRSSIGSRLSMEDYRSRAETLSWDPSVEALRKCVLEARDTKLTENLRSQLHQSSTDVRRVAIVFGAMHMRAVLKELRKNNYSSVESGWHTVFSL